MDNSDFILFERFYTVTIELADGKQVGRFSYSSLWVWLDRFVSHVEEVAGREIDETDDLVTLESDQLIRMNRIVSDLAQEDLELGPNNPACTRPISSHLFGILTAAIICPARDALDDKRLRFRFEFYKADEIRIDENTALSGGFTYE